MAGWRGSAGCRHTASALAAGVAAVLGAAGCVSSVPSPVTPAGQSGSPPAGPQTAAPAADTGGRLIAPLTGLTASAAAAARPAVALVVSGPHPAGLGSADVVFEEIPAPAVRYIAVFQSRNAATVGPVTSTRPADGMALSVLHPLTGYDGGSAGFLDVLHSTKIVDAGFSGHRSLYRSAPGRVTASTAAIEHVAPDTAPPPLLEYQGEPGLGDQLASTGVRRISWLRVAAPGRRTQAWAYSSRTRRWTLTSGGPRVTISNLVIQHVAYKQVFQSHRYRIMVPSARVIGSGRVLAVTGSGARGRAGQTGEAAAGTWSKPGLADVTNFLDGADLPMAFRPGPTWIILAPKGTRVDTG